MRLAIKLSTYFELLLMFDHFRRSSLSRLVIIVVGRVTLEVSLWHYLIVLKHNLLSFTRAFSFVIVIRVRGKALELASYFELPFRTNLLASLNCCGLIAASVSAISLEPALGYNLVNWYFSSFTACGSFFISIISEVARLAIENSSCYSEFSFWFDFRIVL